MELFEEIRRGYAAGETIQGIGEEAWRASADGAAGDRQRDPAGAKAARTGAAADSVR